MGFSPATEVIPIMPYLNGLRKTWLEPIDSRISTCDLQAPGDLNYLFTRLYLRYLRNKGESYQSYNDIVGALECCKLELYRRLVGHYEDEKREANGDVSGMTEDYKK